MICHRARRPSAMPWGAVHRPRLCTVRLCTCPKARRKPRVCTNCMVGTPSRTRGEGYTPGEHWRVSTAPHWAVVRFVDPNDSSTRCSVKDALWWAWSHQTPSRLRRRLVRSRIERTESGHHGKPLQPPAEPPARRRHLKAIWKTDAQGSHQGGFDWLCRPDRV